MLPLSHAEEKDMINTSSVVESLNTLAEQVQDSDPGGYDRLHLLKDAVENNMHADAWAYADVHAMIAPDSIVERYRNNASSGGMDRFVALLEVVRNTLIFTPIIVTWYGISQATARYTDLINAAVQAKRLDLYSQPFLYLWQQRFGGTLPEYLTLSSIAIADVVLLLFILALTFFAYILSGSSTARKDQEAQLLRANLNHAITGAVLSLRARPQLTAGDNLEVVARNLEYMVRQTVDQIQKMSQDSAASLDKLAQDTSTRMERMALDTTSRFDKVARDVTTQFANSTQQTRAQLDQIVQEITRQVQAGSVYLTELGSLTSGIVKTASQIHGAANALQNTNTALNTSINNLVAPADTIARQQGLLLDAVQKSVGHLQGNAKNIGELVTRQQKMAAELSDTLDTLTLAVEKFAALGKEQSTLVQQQGSFLQSLSDEHNKQGQLAVLLSDATIGVKNALSEMNTGAISLRSMAVSMNDMMRLQAAMVDNPGMAAVVDLSNITQHYENAAYTMESSGNTLKASAIAIQRASQQLRDVLDAVPTTATAPTVPTARNDQNTLGRKV
jgi:Skp family chaperone for outer membrane proteins